MLLHPTSVFAVDPEVLELKEKDIKEPPIGVHRRESLSHKHQLLAYVYEPPLSLIWANWSLGLSSLFMTSFSPGIGLSWRPRSLIWWALCGFLPCRCCCSLLPVSIQMQTAPGKTGFPFQCFFFFFFLFLQFVIAKSVFPQLDVIQKIMIK